jgi:hypothetical protein
MVNNIYFDDVYPEIYAEFSAAEARLKPAAPQARPNEKQILPVKERNPRQQSWSGLFRVMALAG